MLPNPHGLQSFVDDRDVNIGNVANAKFAEQYLLKVFRMIRNIGHRMKEGSTRFCQENTDQVEVRLPGDGQI